MCILDKQMIPVTQLAYGLKASSAPTKPNYFKDLTQNTSIKKWVFDLTCK